MKASSLRLPLLSILLAAASIPALAGNYSEGDPRPVALTSSTTRAAVAADTVAAMKTAPTMQHPEGNPRETLQANQNSRAAVVADTMLWVQSGMAALQYGERGADTSSPAYLKAAKSYAALRSQSLDAQTTRAPATGSATVR